MQCAVLSPKFQVKKVFDVCDYSPEAITIKFSQENVDAESCEIFSSGNVVPSSRSMTFKKNSDAEIVASYTGGEEIGKFNVKKGKEEGEMKLKVRLDANGLMVVERGVLEKEGKKVEDLEITSQTGAFGDAEVEKWVEEEKKMVESDRIVIATGEAKNALESYVYELRSKVKGELEKYFEEAGKLVAELDGLEDWLYEEEGGEAATKEELEEKLSGLKKRGEEATGLKFEATNRDACVKVFIYFIIISLPLYSPPPPLQKKKNKITNLHYLIIRASKETSNTSKNWPNPLKKNMPISLKKTVKR